LLARRARDHTEPATIINKRPEALARSAGPQEIRGCPVDFVLLPARHVHDAVLPGREPAARLHAV